MYFLDLEDLKIIKSYKYQSYGVAGKCDLIHSNFQELNDFFKNQTAILFNGTDNAVETCYCYSINQPLEDNSVATDEEMEGFLTAVNIILINFFNYITLDKGRKREHRLGIPDCLSAVKMSYSLLKKAINQQTKINKFNIVVTYKDLTFTLCDNKDIEKKEFIHDVEELEG